MSMASSRSSTLEMAGPDRVVLPAAETWGLPEYKKMGVASARLNGDNFCQLPAFEAWLSISAASCLTVEPQRSIPIVIC